MLKAVHNPGRVRLPSPYPTESDVLLSSPTSWWSRWYVTTIIKITVRKRRTPLWKTSSSFQTDTFHICDIMFLLSWDNNTSLFSLLWQNLKSVTVIWGGPRGEAFQLSTSQSQFVKYCLAKKFLNVKLLPLTSKMWKKYLIIPIVIFISPVIGGKRKKSGERFYDSFRYLYITTSSLRMNYLSLCWNLLS